MTAPALPRCGPTHHHACACREAHFAQVERELAEARAALAARDQTIRTMHEDSLAAVRATAAERDEARAALAQLRDAVCAARRYLAAHLLFERAPTDEVREMDRDAYLQELRDTLHETAPAFRVRVKETR